ENGAAEAVGPEDEPVLAEPGLDQRDQERHPAFGQRRGRVEGEGELAGRASGGVEPPAVGGVGQAVGNGRGVGRRRRDRAGPEAGEEVVHRRRGAGVAEVEREHYAGRTPPPIPLPEAGRGGETVFLPSPLRGGAGG